MKKEDSGFSSGAVPRGGARSCGGVCREEVWRRSGTQDDPWLITSPKDLIALAEFLNSGDAAKNYNNCKGYYFKQTADIDLTGVAWEPIGYSGSTCFSGNYDGDGHIIANAYSEGKADIDTEGNYSSTAGIFGWVVFGSVQNLHVKAATFVATGKRLQFCGRHYRRVLWRVHPKLLGYQFHIGKQAQQQQ